MASGAIFAKFPFEIICFIIPTSANLFSVQFSKNANHETFALPLDFSLPVQAAIYPVVGHYNRSCF